MEISTLADVFMTLAHGQRVGALRRSFRRTTKRAFLDLADDMNAARLAVIDGLSKTGAARLAAWDKVLATTAKLAGAHDLVAQLGSLDRMANGFLDALTERASQLAELTSVPDALLPVDVRAQVEAMREGGGDPARFARRLLDIDSPSQTSGMTEALRSMTRVRLMVLHARVLGAFADASPSVDAATEQQLATLGDEVSTRVSALRTAARESAIELRDRGAGPAFALRLWGALFEFERWIETEGGAALAATAAAATARVSGNRSDAERWAREVGKAYDALRMGLAFDAGIRDVLLAYSAHDDRMLTEFMQTGELPVGSATLDLPRSSLSDVAQSAEGEEIEIDGLVRDAAFRVGPPSNRSVLSVGRSNTVRVLIPHVAVDSFGVVAGTWIQVRGRAYPAGKDGIAGPVVMAGRIRREQAARDSFTDALIFAGRKSFDLRPGELDLVASRVAGDPVALKEIGRGQ